MARATGRDDVLVVFSKREFEALELLLGRMTPDEKSAIVGEKNADILREIFLSFADE